MKPLSVRENKTWPGATACFHLLAIIELLIINLQRRPVVVFFGDWRTGQHLTRSRVLCSAAGDTASTSSYEFNHAGALLPVPEVLAARIGAEPNHAATPVRNKAPVKALPGPLCRTPLMARCLEAAWLGSDMERLQVFGGQRL